MLITINILQTTYIKVQVHANYLIY